MLAFDIQGRHFQVRAAAVVIDDGHLLVHRAPGDAHWALPGGRVELDEDATTTVVREMKEELGLDVRCGELLHVAENFFALAGRRRHEIGLYFRVDVPAGAVLADKTRSHAGIEAQRALEFRWLALDRLESINLRPTFLRRSLAMAPLTFSHVVQREEG